MTTSTKRPDGGELDPMYLINARLDDLVRANAVYKKDTRMSAVSNIERNDREISWLKDLRSTLLIAPTNESPAPQAAATPPTIGGKTAFERIHDRIADYLKSSDPATGITGFIFERFINVPPPIATQPAPQPPVEGLVPVYVKKWRTLIMVPPSIRDEINADIAGFQVSGHADALRYAINALEEMCDGSNWPECAQQGEGFKAYTEACEVATGLTDELRIALEGFQKSTPGAAALASPVEGLREALKEARGLIASQVSFNSPQKRAVLTRIDAALASPSLTAVVSKSKISNFDTAKATVRREMRDIHAFVGFPDGSPEAPPSAPDVREALRAKINEMNILVREYDTSNPDWAFRSGVMLTVLADMCRDLDALLSAQPAKGER